MTKVVDGEVLMVHPAKNKKMPGEALILLPRVVEAQATCSRKLKMQI